MNRLLSVFILCPIFAAGIEKAQVDQMLATAATTNGSAYVTVRTAIMSLGPDALPLLRAAATDSRLSWQNRLVARICYERAERGSAIQALRGHDWRSYPPYRGVPEPGQQYVRASGPASEMTPYVVPKCKAASLWYYYIELVWKETAEFPMLRPRSDPKFDQAWPSWCRDALKGEPESSYLVLAIGERLQRDPSLEARENIDLYRELLASKNPEGASVLLERFDAFIRRELPGPEVYPSSHDATSRAVFAKVLSLCDSRRASTLGEFISEHPSLGDWRTELAVVLRRQPAPPWSDPPFRCREGP